ncbi:MAG: hypothetical protein AAFX76_13810 [Planctomycetota bacterium]
MCRIPTNVSERTKPRSRAGLYLAGVAVGVGLLASALMGATAAAEPTPREILDPWTGTWHGEFIVYGQNGEKQTTLDVRQRYWWDGDIQRAEFVETDPDGNVVTAEARNYADANGRLVCEVDKSTGESSKHFGTFTDGYLFWHGDTPGRVETFRERVEVDDAGRRTYTITGFGAYGRGESQQFFFFVGRYAEVTDTASDA